MKSTLVRIILLGTVSMTSIAFAAPPSKFMDQVQDIAKDLDVPFDTKKPVFAQTIELRQTLRERTSGIARMTSRHTFRCKRARRQLLEVNYLLREMRAEGSAVK